MKFNTKLLFALAAFSFLIIALVPVLDGGGTNKTDENVIDVRDGSDINFTTAIQVYKYFYLEGTVITSNYTMYEINFGNNEGFATMDVTVNYPDGGSVAFERLLTFSFSNKVSIEIQLTWDDSRIYGVGYYREPSYYYYSNPIPSGNFVFEIDISNNDDLQATFIEIYDVPDFMIEDSQIFPHQEGIFLGILNKNTKDPEYTMDLLSIDIEKNMTKNHNLELSRPYFSLDDIENELVLIYQNQNGDVHFTKFDKDLDIIQDKTIYTLDNNIGFENRFFTVTINDEIYLIAYLDFFDPYKSWECKLIRIDANGNFKKSSDLENIALDEGFEPSLFFSLKGKIYLFEQRTMQFRVFNTELNELEAVPLNMDEEINSIRSMWAMYVGSNILCFFEESGYQPTTYFFESYSSGEIPVFGPIDISEDITIEDQDISYLSSVTVRPGVNMIIKNSTITLNKEVDLFPEDIDLINLGTIILENSSIISTNEDNSLANFGTLTINGGSITSAIYNGGYLTTNVDILRSNAFYQNGGDITFNGVVFDGSYDLSKLGYVRSFPNQEEYGIKERGWINYRNCEIHSVSTLTSKIDYSLSLQDSMIDSEIFHFRGNVIRLENSLISCSKECVFQGDSIEARDMEFTNCPDLSLTGKNSFIEDCRFSSSTIKVNVERVSNCEFIGCSARAYSGDGFYVDNCTFSFSEDALRIGSIKEIVVQNCLFEDNQQSLSIDTIIEDRQSIIRNNRFINDNISIYFKGYDYGYSSFFDYDDPDDILRARVPDFIDCRYNYWDTSEPKNVAKRISDEIYFLPFYNLDGKLISTDDNDLDQMNDKWEKDNGLDPEYYFDRFMDQDHDYYSNYDEYMTGTDPNDKGSSPARDYRIKTLVLYSLITILPTLLLLLVIFYVLPIRREYKRLEITKKYWTYSIGRTRTEKRAMNVQVVRKPAGEIKTIKVTKLGSVKKEGAKKKKMKTKKRIKAKTKESVEEKKEDASDTQAEVSSEQTQIGAKDVEALAATDEQQNSEEPDTQDAHFENGEVN